MKQITSMDRFWHFARRMLRHRSMLGLAMFFAVISAGGMGAGILGIIPVLKNIIGTKEQQRGLRDMARDLIDALGRQGVDVPDFWIYSLSNKPFDAVVAVICGLGLLTIVGAAANFLHAYFSLTVVARTIANIRRDAFRRSIHLPLRTIFERGPADTVSRIVYDTTTLASGFTALVSKAVAQVTKGGVLLAVAFVLDPRLFVISLVVGAVLAVIIRKLGKRIRRASRSALTAQGQLYQSASEVLNGLRVVKAFTAERFEAGRFHMINKEVVRQEMKARTARALSSPLIETLALFVRATPTEPGHGHRLARLPRHAESITFDGVSFTYANSDRPALDNVSLRIPHGQVVAFVGPNGCGKTTLLSMIPRFIDPDPVPPSAALSHGTPNGHGVSNEAANGVLRVNGTQFPLKHGPGRVLIDDRDIREFSVRSVRRQIGVVTQDTVLFEGTIRSNIAYGDGAESATDAEVVAAAKLARAEDFILNKPTRYDSPIGENGVGLSGGQRQRLTIARAILRDPAILILDEATSMIDADSESKIADAISDFVGKGLAPGGKPPAKRTCLIVAHRLSTVIHADRIVVMDQGRIVDEGTHTELLARCGVYQLIAQNQLVGTQA